MICMCIPGYVGDADIACNLRKIYKAGLTNIHYIPTTQEFHNNKTNKKHINGLS